MATLSEGFHDGEFLLSEANGNRSREVVTLTGGPYVAGQVLGKITASGKYTEYDNGASDGTQAAAAILYAAADGSAADVQATVIIRDAEISSSALTGSDANGVTDLLALGIIVR